ncbi:phospholipase D family protein [Bacillus cereus]
MQTFFVNPGNCKKLRSNIIEEIRNAKVRILVAVGFFSDEGILKAIKENTKVNEKKVILNKADLDRPSEPGKKPIGSVWAKEKLYVVTLGSYHGSTSNNMHHKFAIIDNTVWVGTFNFTTGASLRNWECMFKINTSHIVNEFTDEFYRMYRLGLFSNENRSEFIKNTKCTLCNKEIYDSNKHFVFKTIHYLDYRFYMNGHGSYEATVDSNETSFEISCTSHTSPPSKSECSDCGKTFEGFELTKCILEEGYENDGSAVYYEAYNPNSHKSEVTTKYKCTKCFANTAGRSLHLLLWEPGESLPNYR